MEIWLDRLRPLSSSKLCFPFVIPSLHLSNTKSCTKPHLSSPFHIACPARRFAGVPSAGPSLVILRASQSFGELRSPMPLARFGPCPSSGSRRGLLPLVIVLIPT